MWQPLGIAGTVVLVCLGAGVAVGLYVGLQPLEGPLDPPNPTEPLPPSSSPLGYYYDAAVTSNCAPCAKIGRDVLIEGGSAVDAAIAVLFCDGAACFQSMGIGGGFFMTIYDKPSGEVITLNARETAPGAAYEDMYGGDPELALRGGLAVAVPGEVRGYWAAHQRFGRLNWSRLIEPTIEKCEEGIVLTEYQAQLFRDNQQHILQSPTMSEMLVNPETGELYGAGDRIFRPIFANTLRTISTEGADALYNGSLAQILINDLTAMGGIITLSDMENYQVRWEDPVVIDLNDNLIAYSTPAPGSGPLSALILNVLDGFIRGPFSSITYHRIVETFKWAFGQRTMLGDPHFVDIEALLTNLTSQTFADEVRSQIDDTRTFSDPSHYGARTAGKENHGTAHISILAPDGSAVSVTSTINYVLGAMIRSVNTDIIYNNEMDDFSSPNITNIYGLPPSPENFIVPGKRPLSSMCPTIVLDEDKNVRLVVGSSGGTKIATSVPWVTMRNLWFNETIKEAIDAPRIHHQLFPMEAAYEYGTIQSVVNGLESIGHVTARFTGGSSVTAVARDGEFITANADHRREAMIAGY